MATVTQDSSRSDGASPDAPGLPTAEAVRLVYGELRRLARSRLQAESAGHSVQPTGLAHETVMRLLGSGRTHWSSPGHFFGAAAEVMRRVLIDAARKRAAAKRGPDVERAAVPVETLVAPGREAEVVAVGAAIDDLAEIDPDAAQLVNLRYFAGLTMAEAAAVMGISKRTAERIWSFARAWLARELGATPEADGSPSGDGDDPVPRKPR